MLMKTRSTMWAVKIGDSFQIKKQKTRPGGAVPMGSVASTVVANIIKKPRIEIQGVSYIIKIAT